MLELAAGGGAAASFETIGGEYNAQSRSIAENTQRRLARAMSA